MKTEDIGTICPACERANGCQITSDKKCWCFEIPVDKLKLEQALKDKLKNQCLCRECLKNLSV
ncbi:MAG: hypothetical protein B7X83_03820 [Polynucleobacter sp. 17-46-58]|nr:MAG: hypothetical protein B7Y55_02065 [Polynucleobacter sp. 35-46-207]OYZ37218.1 MAG: hypothetical protein B7Y22_03795 [Polynucleobacter sp. 16-46-70]OZA40875.1 MAG: hypothetical protein B7X83_03820 [Polynucleobacter sp. 17-46-58]OZB48663.1 MAG: hypothetical protein B7X60_03445 [Polynucleobacter sp. 39-45-136]